MLLKSLKIFFKNLCNNFKCCTNNNIVIDHPQINDHPQIIYIS